jgi:hypothetical protein
MLLSLGVGGGGGRKRTASAAGCVRVSTGSKHELTAAASDHEYSHGVGETHSTCESLRRPLFSVPFQILFVWR